MNEYLKNFLYLIAGSYLITASWRAGLGLLLTAGLAGWGPDFALFLGINLLGLYAAIVATIFFIVAAIAVLKNWAKEIKEIWNRLVSRGSRPAEVITKRTRRGLRG
jgi:hypothetical protein